MNNFNDFEKVAVMDGPFSVWGYRKKTITPVYNESDYDWTPRQKFLIQCIHEFYDNNGVMMCCKCGTIDDNQPQVFIDYFSRPLKKKKADSPRVKIYIKLFQKLYPNEEKIIGLVDIKFFDQSYIKLKESELFTQRCPLMKDILYFFLKKYGRSDLLKTKVPNNEKINEITFILNYRSYDKAYIPSPKHGETSDYFIPSHTVQYGNVFSEQDVEDFELEEPKTETDGETDDELETTGDEPETEQKQKEETNNEPETDDEPDSESEPESDGETTGDEEETTDNESTCEESDYEPEEC